MLVEEVEDLVVEVGCMGLCGCDFEVSGISGESQGDGVGCSGGAVFDSEADKVVSPFEVEVGIAPAMWSSIIC